MARSGQQAAAVAPGSAGGGGARWDQRADPEERVAHGRRVGGGRGFRVGPGRAGGSDERYGGRAVTAATASFLAGA